MGLSLKKDEMIRYLEEIKGEGESFSSMLWGVCYADLPIIKDRSVVSVIMLFTLSPGVAGTIDNAFCYIGLTKTKLYVVALDAFNTSKIVSTFAIPLSGITSLKIKKGLLGAYNIEIEGDGYITLNVKSTSLGTDIKDQKERLAGFIAEIEGLQNSLNA